MLTITTEIEMKKYFLDLFLFILCFMAATLKGINGKQKFCRNARPVCTCTCTMSCIYIMSLNTELFLIMAGRLVLSPSETLLVCGVGERAEVTCTTTEQVLRWQITVPGENGRTDTRHQSYDSLSQSTTPLEINSSMITFTRTSVQRRLPLTSRLEIDHVSAGLNGTVINCTEVGLNLMNPDTAETVLLILGQDFANGN